MTDDQLRRFATKVVEFQEKSSGRVDETLMREVARELGMSEADLVRVRDESRSHKQRARALRSGGNLDEAISELETAWLFNPLDVEIMYLLADGLFTRSQRTKDAGEWARARELCLQVLEVAPAHDEAPGLLRAIQNRDPSRSSGHAFRMGVSLGLGALVAFLLGLALALSLLR